MEIYQNLLRTVLDEGTWKGNRTGIRTISSFGHSLKFDLRDGFPVITTKKIHLKSVIHELLWFISGNTNVKYLQENGVRIWNEWADEKGRLGPVYGKQWRAWRGLRIDDHGVTFDEEIDQLQRVIDILRTDPDDRRLIVNSWNPVLLPDNSHSFSMNVSQGKQALPPCHYSFQFVSYPGQNGRRELNLLWNQRSVDLFLGLPFNITSYALLLAMVAQCVDMEPRYLVFNGGDCHIYENHVEQVKQQIRREPYPLPELHLNPEVHEIDDFTYDDIKIINYKHHSKLTGKVAV